MLFHACYPSVAGQPKHLPDFQFKQVLLESHGGIHFYLSLVACFHYTFFGAKSFLSKQQHTHTNNVMNPTTLHALVLLFFLTS